MKNNSLELTTTIDEPGEDCHKEIYIIIEKPKSDLDEIDSKHLSNLNKQEEEITHIISEIKANIAELNKLINNRYLLCLCL